MWRNPVGLGANLNRCADTAAQMLIGAHVSTAGGLVKALERAEERGAESMQIFNQSPRMWRPTKYSEADFAAFRERLADSPVESVYIHAVYLINVASDDAEVCHKSLDLPHPRAAVGDGIGAGGVIVHPGSGKGQAPGPTFKQLGKALQGGARGDRARARCCSRTRPAPASRSGARSRSWRG